MLKCITILGLTAVLLLTGCATAPAPRSTGAMVTGTTTHALPTTCATQQQPGCIEFRALNYRMDPQNALLARYVKSPETESERRWRVQHASPELWQAYMKGMGGKGDLQAAGQRSWRFFIWNANSVPAGDLQAYRINGKNFVTKVKFRDVTGSVPYPDTSLGAPSKVYEVDATGSDAIGASIQFPWAMFTDNTVMLICATDNDGIYPSGKVVNGMHDGMWWTKESIRWLRNMDGNGRASLRTLSAFVSSR